MESHAVIGKTIGQYYQDNSSSVEELSRAVLGKRFGTTQVGLPKEYKVIGVRDVRWTNRPTAVYQIDIEKPDGKRDNFGIEVLMDDFEIIVG
jgi:hypothetical protein